MNDNEELVEWTEQRLNRRYMVSRMGRLGFSIAAAGAALGAVDQFSAKKSTNTDTDPNADATD